MPHAAVASLKSVDNKPMLCVAPQKVGRHYHFLWKILWIKPFSERVPQSFGRKSTEESCASDLAL